MGNEEEDLQIISINFHIKEARRREQLIYIKRISKSIVLHWTSASRESQHYCRSSALNTDKLHPASFCLQVVTPLPSPPELPKGSEQTAREPKAGDIRGLLRDLAGNFSVMTSTAMPHIRLGIFLPGTPAPVGRN